MIRVPNMEHSQYQEYLQQQQQKKQKKTKIIPLKSTDIFDALMIVLPN